VVLFFFQAEDGIRDFHVTGVQTCALPISSTLNLGDTIRRLINAAEGLFPDSTNVTIQLLDNNNTTMETIAASESLERAKENVKRSEERRVGKESRERREP